ncbi:MAG: hypothetical protein ACREOE_04375 [Gemmatimonadales bacterium]
MQSALVEHTAREPIGQVAMHWVSIPPAPPPAAAQQVCPEPQDAVLVQATDAEPVGHVVVLHE